MKKLGPYIVSGIISVIIILLTGWIAFYRGTSILHDICFFFHLIPFGIGFSGGGTASVILYYFILWIVLAVVIIPIVAIYNSSRNKRLILISIISICSLGFLGAVWVDYSRDKEREDRVLQNKNEDKENFKSFKTGDIIFQTRNTSGSINSQSDSDSIDNKIAIIDVDIHGYTVLEISDRVQYTSLRSWIREDGNYTVKRLMNADSILTDENIEKLRQEGQKYVFKSYDYSYCWSDGEIYGSELIWKIYKRALNIEIGTLEISTNSGNQHEEGNCLDKFSVSPMTIFNSDKLITVMTK